MNEVSFECGTADLLTVTIMESETETHKVEIEMDKILTEPDWCILQVENFEVRIQFLLSDPLPVDFLDTAFDVIVGPRAWYFKAEDLYALIKTITQQLKLPDQLGVTSEDIITRVSKLVDLATEAVIRRFTSLSAEEEVHVLQTIDELLINQCIVFDSVIDSSRSKLAESLRKLKVSLEASLKEHKQYVEVTVGRSVEAAKDLSTKAVENASTSVEKIAINAKSSFEEAKGQVENYKTQVQQRVDTVKGSLSSRVAILSDESKAWATEFLNKRVVQGKEALTTAQPYVIEAVGATQPYASRVATAAKPYVDMAMPYVEEAKKYAQSNAYVGPYVDPVLNTANSVIDSAKTYMGLGASEVQTQQSVPADAGN